MATPQRVRLQDQIRRELREQGVSVRMLDTWPAKATYYSPDGRACPNLPADAYSMKRYLDRGLTLQPPRESVSPAASADDLVCPECGKGPFKARIGLTGHMRTHK